MAWGRGAAAARVVVVIPPPSAPGAALPRAACTTVGWRGARLLDPPHPGAFSAISGSPAAGGRGVGFAPRGGRSAFVKWPRQDGRAIMAAGVSQRLGAASGSAAPPGTETSRRPRPAFASE